MKRAGFGNGEFVLKGLWITPKIPGVFCTLIPIMLDNDFLELKLTTISINFLQV